MSSTVPFMMKSAPNYSCRMNSRRGPRVIELSSRKCICNCQQSGCCFYFIAVQTQNEIFKFLTTALLYYVLTSWQHSFLLLYFIVILFYGILYHARLRWPVVATINQLTFRSRWCWLGMSGCSLGRHKVRFFPLCCLTYARKHWKRPSIVWG